MTMKTKRGLAVGGGTVFCAVLAILIATRFAPDDAAITTSAPETESKPGINLVISTAKQNVSKPTENSNAATSDTTSNTTPTNSDPEKEAADFIEGGGIEIRQDFPEPEKKTESVPTANTAPTEPPEINDEKMLTDPSKEPTYKPEQIQPQQTEPNSTPKHGDKKNGMIYINGFGWVKDEGGGGVGYTDDEMYQNGNKIGYFG